MGYESEYFLTCSIAEPCTRRICRTEAAELPYRAGDGNKYFDKNWGIHR